MPAHSELSVLDLYFSVAALEVEQLPFVRIQSIAVETISPFVYRRISLFFLRLSKGLEGDLRSGERRH
jgi:hypothetical protein